MIYILPFLISAVFAAEQIDYSQRVVVRDKTDTAKELVVNTDGSINVNATFQSPPNIRIQDGYSSTLATVTKNKAILVDVLNLPVSAQAFFSSYLQAAGGSRAMNVNGSTTPVQFYYQNDSSTQDVYITRLVVTGDDVNIGFLKFYALTTLTNGLLFSLKTNCGTLTDIANFKQNEDIFSMSDSFYINTTLSPNNITFWLEFPQPLKLQRNCSDRIQFTVRDNLTGIDYFTAFAKGFYGSD